MKIGIITFHFADNYGAVLQAYALKSFLQDNNAYDVEIINYISDHFKNAYNINPCIQKTLTSIGRALLKYPIRKLQHNKFDRFRDCELSVNKKAVTNLSNICYDVIVVGSDQVWNFDITDKDINYFIPIHGVNKIAYAASSSNDFISGDYRTKIKELLSDFGAISVRENNLKDIIERDYQISCELVLDPVFLMPRSFWHNLENRPVKIDDNYILVYALEKNVKLEKTARILSETTGCQIIVVHPLLTHVFSVGKLLTNVGPKDFLWLIENSQFVVSNSFHAFAFSMIFRKEMYFDYVKNTSSRVASLIDNFNIPVEYVEEFGTYHSIFNFDDNSLYEKIQSSKDFLIESINARAVDAR